MPIKFPDSNEYRIPEEISQFEDLIKQIANFEHSFNNKIDDLYCYITIDQKIVKQNEFTRKKASMLMVFKELDSRTFNYRPLLYCFGYYSDCFL